MKNHEFDKEVRQKALEQADSFDMESMWASVEPQIVQEKDKRRYFVWFFFGLLAVSLVFSLGLLPSSELATNSVAGVPSEYRKTSESLKGERLSSSSEQLVLKQTDNIDVTNQVSSIEQDAEYEIAESSVPPVNIVLSTDLRNSKLQRDEKASENQLTSPSARMSDVPSPVSSSKEVILNVKNSQDHSAEEDEKAFSSTLESKSVFDDLSSNSLTNSDLAVTFNDATSNVFELLDEERGQLNKLTVAPLVAMGWLAYSRALVSSPELTIVDKQTKNSLPSYLGVSFTYSKMWNTMNLRDGGDPTVFNLRNSQEKPVDAFAFAIDYSKYFRTNWAVDLSLNIEKQFHKRDAITVRMGDTLLQDFVVSRQVSSNGVVEQIEDVLVNNTTRFSEQTYLRFTQVGIKLGLRYAVQMKQWKIGATAGLEPQLLMSKSGLISQGDWRYDIQEDADEIFNRGIQLNSYGSLFVTYPITERFHMDLHFNMSSPLQDRYRDTYAIRERNTLYGLRAAFKIKL